MFQREMEKRLSHVPFAVLRMDDILILGKMIIDIMKKYPCDPYENWKVKLSIDQAYLIWGNCVIVPKSLQPNVLESLHEAHPGMSRMKSLARLYFW